MKLNGRAWKFGANIDTDLIIPARYLNTSEPAELARHCMEDADPAFMKKIAPGDIIVGGENFGCGSSREHAPIAIKAAGISAVIAKSFARIFYRNALNIGLPILECPEAVDGIKEGDNLEIDLDTGAITNPRTNQRYQMAPFPPFMRQLIQAGGLLNYVRNNFKKGAKRK